MSRIVKTIGIAPKPVYQGQNINANGAPVTNPQQQTQQAQQQAQQPQQMTGFDNDSLFKLASKGVQKFANSGIWAAPTTNGLATGALSAGGGTYVTGAGLAGTAGPIHTTAGAAGASGGGGFASGIKGGLASAGAGIVGGFLGGKIFGTKEAATGSGLGSSIGWAAGGPIGALAGGILGGIAGKIIGGDKDEPFVEFTQGASLSKYSGNNRYKKLTHQKIVETPLGKFGFGEDELKPKHWNPIFKAIKDSDKAVADLLDQDQLARAKAGLNSFDAGGKDGVRGTKVKGDRVQNLMNTFLKERYSMAMGGLDLDYKGTFDRVANKGNMGGLVSTLSQMDRDIRDKSGVFSDFNPEKFDPTSVSPDDSRLKKRITIPNPRAGLGKKEMTKYGWSFSAEPDTITIDNPDYDQELAEKVDNYKVTTGYDYKGTDRNPIRHASGLSGLGFDYDHKYDKQTDFGNRIGDQALQHLANKYGIDSKPTAPEKIKPTAFQARQIEIEKSRPPGWNSVSPSYEPMPEGGWYSKTAARIAERNSQQNAAYSKRLGAWEKEVLDEYVNKYDSSMQQQTAGNVAAAVSNVQRTQTPTDNSVQVQGQGSGLLSRFAGVETGGIRRNSAAQVDNDATNANKLKTGIY